MRRPGWRCGCALTVVVLAVVLSCLKGRLRVALLILLRLHVLHLLRLHLLRVPLLLLPGGCRDVHDGDALISEHRWRMHWRRHPWWCRACWHRGHGRHR